jgi:tripartite-type tricarboxylate transporter receptor subunit TctC
MYKPTAFCLALGACLAASPAYPDDVADFYKGRTVTITAASGAGGGYGVYALLLADHVGKYIPGNPNVIVNYNPGGGGVIAANYAYSVAPKDGTAILAPLQSLPTLQVIGKKGIRYDAAKFQWIGRAAETTSGFIVRSSVAKNPDALWARKEETIVGITQIGAPNHILPALVKYCPGANLKLVSGYKGSPPIALAFNRNEVDGLALPLDSLRVVYRHILKDTMIAQSGLERAKDFPNVPLTIELCKDKDKRKVVEFFQTQELMGRSYAVPPGTPADRVEALRKAFDRAIKDPALLATARERKLEIEPMSGQDLQKLVTRHIGTAGATVDAAKRAVGLQ